MLDAVGILTEAPSADEAVGGILRILSHTTPAGNAAKAARLLGLSRSFACKGAIRMGILAPAK